MIYIILSNIILYVILRAHLVRKFKTSYSIYLTDEKGQTQSLSKTIAYLLEQNEIKDKKIMYLAGEMEKQWLAVEQINTVTGADKYCTEKPSPNPFK